MNLEPFFYLALFLLIILITFISQWLRSELEKEAAPEIESEKPSILGKDHRIWPTLTEEPLRFRKVQPGKEFSLTHLTRQESQRKRLTRLGSLRDLRRGIVLMTILGPCRALERPNDPTHF